jgi:hypothetical protein
MTQGINSFREFAGNQYDRLSKTALEVFVFVMNKVGELADQTLKKLSNFFISSREKQKGATCDIEMLELPPSGDRLDEFKGVADFTDLGLGCNSSTQEAQDLVEEIKNLMQKKGFFLVEDADITGSAEVSFEVDSVAEEDLELDQQSINDNKFETLRGLSGNELVDLRVFLEGEMRTHPDDKEIARIYQKVIAVEEKQIAEGTELALRE